MFHKFACLITGEDPEIIKKQTSRSRKKIYTGASLLSLITIIWFIQGFFISHSLLQQSLTIGIFAAFICGFVIFIIERAILLSDSGPVLSGIRILLGISLAIIGSLLVDSLFLKDDVDLYLKEKYAAEAEVNKNTKEAEMAPQIATQNQLVRQAYDTWQKRVEEYKCEMDGTCGSRIPGHAKIAASKLQLKNEAKAEYEKQNGLLAQLIERQNYQSKEAKQAKLDLTGNKSLLHRIENMHEMICSSYSSKLMYWLLFTIVLCIELMVVIFKLCSKKSSYEQGELIAEEMLERKYNDINRKSLEFNNYQKQFGTNERNAIESLNRDSKHALLN